MTKAIFLALSMFATHSLAGVAYAQDDHSHDHDQGDAVDVTSLDDGWVALEGVSAEIQSAIAANNMDALHELSDELHAVADSLGKLANYVPQANQLRYTSSVNQLRTFSDRLHMAHEEGNAAAAQQMAPQLNGVVQLLMVRAEAN
jgi:hypothetical protein